MKYIPSFKEFLNEKLNFKSEQSKYEDWEKGVIMAWGHVLYLGYHNVKNSISKIVDMKETQRSFLEYYNEGRNDEDMQDWMSDEPPTLNHGYALFDKNRLSNIFSSIANKTKLKEPLIVHRSSDKEYEEGDWNSYTTSADGDYEGAKKSYKIPVGYPVIFASVLADNNEVILNISKSDQKKFQI